MTPRELAGWVPAERHEHYDADDNLTGYTVVIRESRINDDDRTSLLGLAMFEDQLCRCGFHPSLTDDDDNMWEPGVRKCPVCAGEAQWDRMLHDEDEAAAKAAPDASGRAPRPSDGRHPYMRLLSPDEAAELRQTRSNRPSRG
jgi:hypothetical protein